MKERAEYKCYPICERIILAATSGLCNHDHAVIVFGKMHTPAARGNAMRFVPILARESFRARLEHQIDDLKVLVRRMGANSRDLEATGEHVSATLETLDQDGRIEVARSNGISKCRSEKPLEYNRNRPQTIILTLNSQERATSNRSLSGVVS